MRRIVACLGLLIVGWLGARQATTGGHSAVVADSVHRQSDALPAWYRQYPPHPGNPVSVACSGAVCFAAGTDGDVLKSEDDGGAWQRTPARLPERFTFRTVACRSEAVCVVAGSEGQESAVFTTTDSGARWRRQTFAGASVIDAACPRRGDCFVLFRTSFAAGNPAGGRWTVLPLSLPATAMYPDSLSCPAPATCYVDAHDEYNAGYGAVLATKDGGLRWRAHLLPPGIASGQFAGMACPDPHTCYLVTNVQHNGVIVTHDGWKTHAFHPFGAVSAGRSGPDAEQFAQPACPKDSTCYVRSSLGAVLVTVDGGRSWNRRPLPPAGPPLGFVYDLPLGAHGTACTGPAQCIAVQSDGTIVRTADAGASWTAVSIGTARRLTGIACAAPTACFAVGPRGTLLASTDGATWSRKPYSAHDSTLLALACHGSRLCVAAGTGGGVATWAGSTWTSRQLSVPGFDVVAFQAVACPTDQTCYVGGYAYRSGTPGPERPILFRTDSGRGSWNPVTVPSGTSPINAIACASSDVCVVAGGNASDDDSYPSGTLILSRDGGASWHQVGTEAYFGAAWDGKDAFEVVGQSSDRAPLALRVATDGTVTDRRQDSSPRFFRDSLNAVACPAPDSCTAVGDAGLVAQIAGGAGWADEALGVDQLTAVTCVSGRCYAAGSDSTILSNQAAGAVSPVPTATLQTPPATTPTPIPPPVLPMPTVVPAASKCPPHCIPGMVLYRSHWDRGFDGWHLAGGGTGAWKVRRGILISPPVTYRSPATPIGPPFVPGDHDVADYAVQFQADGIDFDVLLRDQGDQYEDFSAQGCCGNPSHGAIMHRYGEKGGRATIIGDAGSPSLAHGWHTYRMEVRSHRLRLLVDGHVLVTGLDEVLLPGGRIAFTGEDAPVMFRNVVIVSL